MAKCCRGEGRRLLRYAMVSTDRYRRHSEASVGLHPYNTWPSGETKRELISRMAARFHAMPGFDVGFSQPMIDGVNDKIAGAHSELVIKIFGDDFNELRRIAKEVVDILEATPGA